MKAPCKVPALVMVKDTALDVEIEPLDAVPIAGARRAVNVGALVEPASVQRLCDAIVSLMRVADDVVTLPPEIVIVKPVTMEKFKVVPVVPVVAMNVPFKAANEPVPAALAMVNVSPTPKP